jgi:malonate transporter
VAAPDTLLPPYPSFTPTTHMSVVLNLTIPFFALIFLGMFCRAVGFVDQRDARMMAKYAFFIAMPTMVFVKIGAGSALDFLNWGFIWRYELATAIVFILSALVARPVFSLSRLESGIFGLNAAYPNYGYIGVPLAILALGDAAALPLALILAMDTVVLLVLTGWFATSKTVAGGGAFGKTLWKALATVAKNPLLISAVLGLAYAASDVPTPGMLASLLDMIADSAAPVALFALGATVYGQPLKNAIGELTAISVARLIIHPLLMAALFLLLPGVDPLWIKAALLSACLPVAANVFVLSDHYGGYTARSASAILMTTILASITVPVALYIIMKVV